MAVPDAPTALVTGYTIPNVIDLSWTKPAAGDAPTGYVLYSGSEEGVYTGTLLISGSDTLTYQFTGTENVLIGTLGNGETVYFKIHSVNGDGESVLFDDNTGVTMDVPYVCQNPAVVATGSTTLEFTWEAPVFNGGSELLQYDIWVGETATTVFTATTATTVFTYTESGLTTGTTRYFQVAANNAIGTGVLTTAESGQTWYVPDAPTGLTVEAGDGQAYITTWVAPVDYGGTAITDYYLYRGVTSGSLVKVHEMGSGVVAAYLDSGLTNGTTYFYAMSAVNSVGEGAQGAEVTAGVAVAPVTSMNSKLYIGGAVKTLIYSLAGSSSYTLPLPTRYEVLSIIAGFANETNVGVAEHIIVDTTNKTVKVYDAAGLSPKEFALRVVVTCK